MGFLQQKLEKAEKTIEDIDEELQSTQEENRRWRSEHNSLLMQLETLRTDQQDKTMQIDTQSAELTAAQNELQQFREQVEILQSQLASSRANHAAEKARADEEQKRREIQERQLARAKEEKAARLVREELQHHNVEPDDRLEKSEKDWVLGKV